MDDMQLRKDNDYHAFSLMICSENTKLSEYKSMRPDFLEGLYLIKLDNTEDTKFKHQIFSKNEDLYASDILIEYLSKINLNVIKK